MFIDKWINIWCSVFWPSWLNFIDFFDQIGCILTTNLAEMCPVFWSSWLCFSVFSDQNGQVLIINLASFSGFSDQVGWVENRFDLSRWRSNNLSGLLFAPAVLDAEGCYPRGAAGYRLACDHIAKKLKTPLTPATIGMRRFLFSQKS